QEPAAGGVRGEALVLALVARSGERIDDLEDLIGALRVRHQGAERGPGALPLAGSVRRGRRSRHGVHLILAAGFARASLGGAQCEVAGRSAGARSVAPASSRCPSCPKATIAAAATIAATSATPKEKSNEIAASGREEISIVVMAASSCGYAKQRACHHAGGGRAARTPAFFGVRTAEGGMIRTAAAAWRGWRWCGRRAGSGQRWRRNQSTASFAAVPKCGSSYGAKCPAGSTASCFGAPARSTAARVRSIGRKSCSAATTRSGVGAIRSIQRSGEYSRRRSTDRIVTSFRQRAARSPK